MFSNSDSKSEVDNLASETGQQVQDQGLALSLSNKSKIKLGRDAELTIAQTDHGSIDKSFDFAGDALEGAEAFLGDALNFVDDLRIDAKESKAGADAVQVAAAKANARALENIAKENNQLATDLSESNYQQLAVVSQSFADSVLSITSMAETEATGGANLSIDLLKWLGIGFLVVVVIIVGIVAWGAYR